MTKMIVIQNLLIDVGFAGHMISYGLHFLPWLSTYTAQTANKSYNM